MFAEFTIIGRIAKITTLEKVTKLTIATPYWNHSARKEETRWNSGFTSTIKFRLKDSIPNINGYEPNALTN